MVDIKEVTELAITSSHPILSMHIPKAIATRHLILTNYINSVLSW